MVNPDLWTLDAIIEAYKQDQRHIEADLEMKQAALERMDAPSTKSVRFEAKDRLLHFLEWR